MNSQPAYNDPVNNNFEFFFQNSLCGFIIADARGLILWANSKIAAWSGHTAEELKGKRFPDLLTIGGKIYYETHLWPMLRMQGFFEEVLLEISTTGSAKSQVLVNALEHRNKENNALAIHYTVLKASDRLLYEQNLQQSKKEAEKELSMQKETVALREQLIAVLGHDLRNPLAAIRLGLELLGQSTDAASDNEIIATIKRSGARMTELVDTVMDFARTRLGEGILLKRQHVVLKPVLEQIILELQLAYPKRQVISVFDMEEPVDCDPDRIAQLLSNLLANALTYGSADSPVNVGAIHHNGVLEIFVSNQGKPIPADLQEKIFTPFTREHSRLSRNGLGLGLYIAAEIAKAHKATLVCVSSEKETRFTLFMPSPV